MDMDWKKYIQKLSKPEKPVKTESMIKKAVEAGLITAADAETHLEKCKAEWATYSAKNAAYTKEKETLRAQFQTDVEAELGITGKSTAVFWVCITKLAGDNLQKAASTAEILVPLLNN